MAFSSKLSEYIKNDKIGVIPTDTIYGVVASAFSKKAVERIYKFRQRDPKKSMIILIGSLADLKLFRIELDTKTKNILEKIWPGKVSVILSCRDKKFRYLHRGTNTLAFRFPQKASLAKLLSKNGPLVAPSANPQGKKPAETIREAKKYFGDRVDFYIDNGKITSPPSTLVEIKNGRIRIIRKGSGKIPKALLKK